MPILVAALASLSLLSADPAGSAAAEPAAASPIVRFNRAVDRALAHREAGRHDQALAALDEALEAIVERSGSEFDRGRSRVRYYKALTLVALARLEEAEALLTLLEQSPGLTDVERDVVQGRLVEVRQRLEAHRASRPGTVEILALDDAGRPVQAVARIDGEDVGATPLTVTLAPGRHRIEVTGAGLEARGQDFTVAPGSSGQLVVRVQTVTREIPFDPPPAAIGTAVGGVVLVGVAGVLHALALDEKARAQEWGQVTRLEGVQLLESARRKAYPAYGLYAVGGALAIGGVVWLLVDGWPEPDDGLGTVTVGAADGGVHVTVGGRF